MAAATITLIGNRLHAINGTITGVHVRRYWPQNYDTSALHPLLFPQWGRAQHQVPGAGARQYAGARAWELVLIVGAWEQGLPTETVSARAEALTEAVIDAYISRPRLELVGDALDGVERVELQSDTGLTPFAENPALACVRFPLFISTHKTFEFNTE